MRPCGLPCLQAEQKEADHELSACLQQLAGQQELHTQQQQQNHRDPNQRRSVQPHQAHHHDEPALDYGAMWSALHSQAEAARAERMRLRSLGRGAAAGGAYGGARAYAGEGQKGAAGVKVCGAGAAWGCTWGAGGGGWAQEDRSRAGHCHVLDPRLGVHGGLCGAGRMMGSWTRVPLGGSKLPSGFWWEVAAQCQVGLSGVGR